MKIIQLDWVLYYLICSKCDLGMPLLELSQQLFVPIYTVKEGCPILQKYSRQAGLPAATVKRNSRKEGDSDITGIICKCRKGSEMVAENDLSHKICT